MPNILLRDISEKDKKALKILAKINKRSLNNEILVALDRYLEEDENYLLVKEALKKEVNQ